MFEKTRTYKAITCLKDLARSSGSSSLDICKSRLKTISPSVPHENGLHVKMARFATVSSELSPRVTLALENPMRELKKTSHQKQPDAPIRQFLGELE